MLFKSMNSIFLVGANPPLPQTFTFQWGSISVFRRWSVMFWVVLAWAGASLCTSTVLWLRYKQGIFYQTSCATAASHVEEDSGSLCLFRGCCVESGIGLCRGEWRGEEGGGGFAVSAGEPGSQSGRWLNHLPSTSRHPPRSPRAHVNAHFHRSTYQPRRIPLITFIKCRP